jgi:hypothetical protein
MKMRLREGLTRFSRIGILGLPVGILLLTIAAYGFARGTDVTFPFDETVVSVLTATEIGILVLFVGLATSFFIVKPSSPIWVMTGLTSCTLIIPAIFLGMGEKIVGGMLANVFGYATLFWCFIWLRTEKLDIGTTKRLINWTALAIAFGFGFTFGFDFGLKLFFPR